MVKYWDSGINKMVPLTELVCKVKIWDEMYGAAYCPNRIDMPYADRLEISFDDIEELRAFRYSVNKMVDSLDDLLSGRREESVTLFKESKERVK